MIAFRSAGFETKVTEMPKISKQNKQQKNSRFGLYSPIKFEVLTPR